MLRTLLALLLLAAARPAFADMTGLIEGTLGDTGYLIGKPDNWNGGPGLGIDAATLNRDIRRVVPEEGARSPANPAFAPFTGSIRVPLMTQHGTADLDVPLRLEQNYCRRTLAAGTSRLLIQRTQCMAAHCDFDQSAREALFDALVAWIERGVVPKGEDLL